MERSSKVIWGVVLGAVASLVSYAIMCGICEATFGYPTANEWYLYAVVVGIPFCTALFGGIFDDNYRAQTYFGRQLLRGVISIIGAVVMYCVCIVIGGFLWMLQNLGFGGVFLLVALLGLIAAPARIIVIWIE